MSFKLLIFFYLLEFAFLYIDLVELMQASILASAKLNSDAGAWALAANRSCRRNKKVFIPENEDKRHLFIYECILAAGYDIGTPYTINPKDYEKYDEVTKENRTKRPPTVQDWFNGNIKGFYIFGENEEGILNCQHGDVITNGTQIAFVLDASNEVTTHLNFTRTFTDNWGFRGRQPNETFKVLRYNGIEKKEETVSESKFYKISIVLLVFIILLG